MPPRQARRGGRVLESASHAAAAPSYVKNTNGSLGPICGYCGGYGFTNSITGASPGCTRCQGTGIEPPDIRAMDARLQALERSVTELVSLLRSGRRAK